jgi:hypothetical protein
MSQTKGYPGFVSAFQQTAAMLRQRKYDGVCWRHLCQRLGFLASTPRPWTSLALLSYGTATHIPEVHPMPKNWS